MDEDRYGGDVLAGDWKTRGRKLVPTVLVERDMVLEDPQSGWAGAVVRIEAGTVELEDFKRRTRSFPVTGQFLLEGELVHVTTDRRAVRGTTPGQPGGSGPGGPAPSAPTRIAPARTASGSFAVADQRARVARPSRIMVEGRHDAELVEKVWGDDLRVEGVVVEYLSGVDNLAEVLDDFRPDRSRRVGVLVDHLVPGSKETRFADAVMRGTWGRHVLVVGHPYVDVWQSVKPERLGLRAWPTVPRSIEWKHGICDALGWPHDSQADIARAWQRILGQVRTFADLEPSLLGRVEELIDFVTEPTGS